MTVRGWVTGTSSTSSHSPGRCNELSPHCTAHGVCGAVDIARRHLLPGRSIVGEPVVASGGSRSHHAQ